ncbi:MAG: hypothetical protein V2A54_09685 [Bacteroidota bacterium]
MLFSFGIGCKDRKIYYRQLFIFVFEMEFQEGHIYHIYNQGNNKQKVFFAEANYLFFINKIKLHVLPYSDILAWCLMPNHFHLMVFVNSVGVTANSVSHARSQTDSRSTTQSRTKVRSINDSIGIMLRSYTRAINKQEKRSGCLFRPLTKAICLTEQNGITASWYSDMGITKIITSEKNYLQSCFDYIHQNPVKAGLVSKSSNWPYSSYNEFYGTHGFTKVEAMSNSHIEGFNSSEAFNTTALLICKNRAEEYGLK